MRTTLYSNGAHGIRVWVVHANGPYLSTYAGDTKSIRLASHKLCEGKNIGRKNETTGEQQAEKEAAALVKDALKKQWALTIEEAVQKRETCDNVMLASNIKEHPEYVVYPIAKQLKLNGMRCDAKLGKELHCQSRKRNEITLCAALFNELNVLLHTARDRFGWDTLRTDGELYKHGWPLGAIISAVKNPKNPNHELLEYHIYDIVSDLPQEDRLVLLDRLREIAEELHISRVIIEQYEILHSAKAHKTALERARNAQYEGLMLRELSTPYYHSRTESDRPSCLIKDKGEMDSEEFIVIDVVEDLVGGGTAVCRIENNENTFRCRLEGDESRRVDLLVNKEKYIGLPLSVRFFGYSQYGVPQNPVGEEFRTYE